MPETVSRWIKGYLYVKIKGYTPERFFNLCRSGQLDYWSVRQDKEGYGFYISLKDFYKIRPLLRKSRVSMKILSRTGLPFLIQRNRKRKALVLAVLSFFALLYIMSLFIWNISFDGNYHYSRETLLDYLEEEQQIWCGMIKYRISCDQLEEGIRSRFPEITWVSARVSGTRLLIKIKENEVLSSIPEAESDPCELIASTSGIITRMIVRQGKASVSPGDLVEAGQQLVSGELSIKNDAAEVIRIAYVHADGDIYARTVRTYSQEFPQYRTVSAKTGRRRRGVGVGIGGIRWRILMPDLKKDSWNFVVNTAQLRLFEDFYLPLYAEEIVGEAYVSYERPYTEEEKKEEARKAQEKYLKNLMEKGVQIIENNVKIQEYGDVWAVEGEVIAEEQIGVKRYITEFEETREADERN